jgi:hypothetical protein
LDTHIVDIYCLDRHVDWAMGLVGRIVALQEFTLFVGLLVVVMMRGL